MTPRRMLRLLATAALAAAVAGVLALLFRAGTTTVAAVSPAPRPTDSTWPFYSPPYPSPAHASPAASAVPKAEAKAATAGTEGPAPFVQTFAAQPGVRPQPALPSPTSTRSIPVNVDGCDHAYGTRTQCIPWTFPDGVTDKCAWLTEHGYVRVKVAGKDRQGLDPDGNGVACDP